MYLVSSGFSFKPTSSSSSSSSTKFSQEWARRKVVVKHSLKSNPDKYVKACNYSMSKSELIAAAKFLGISISVVWKVLNEKAALISIPSYNFVHIKCIYRLITLCKSIMHMCFSSTWAEAEVPAMFILPPCCVLLYCTQVTHWPIRWIIYLTLGKTQWYWSFALVFISVWSSPHCDLITRSWMPEKTTATCLWKRTSVFCKFPWRSMLRSQLIKIANWRNGAQKGVILQLLGMRYKIISQEGKKSDNTGIYIL